MGTALQIFKLDMWTWGNSETPSVAIQVPNLRIDNATVQPASGDPHPAGAFAIGMFIPAMRTSEHAKRTVGVGHRLGPRSIFIYRKCLAQGHLDLVSVYFSGFDTLVTLVLLCFTTVFFFQVYHMFFFSVIWP